jgi:hypothetical protein
MNFAEELEKVKQGIANPATRQQFLTDWFNSDASRITGQDPTRRGNFAREAGLTSDELRQWGSGWHAAVRRDM